MPADYLLQVPENVLPTKRWGSHGIPCVPVLANLYMEMFEEIAKNSWTSTTNLETLFGQHILCHAEDWSWRFPEHFNSIRPTIMFTMEQEDGNLPSWTPSSTGRMTESLKLVYTGSQLTQTDTCISPPPPSPCEERHGLLPLPPSSDHCPEHECNQRGRTPQEGNDYPETFCEHSQQAPYSNRANWRSSSNNLHPLCSRTEWGCETGMPML